MLIFLISLSLSLNIQKDERSNFHYRFSNFSLEKFVNDYMNDGIDFIDLSMLFNNYPSFESVYEEKLNLLTKQNIQIFPKSFKISSYFDLKQKLSSISTINELISIYRPQFIAYKDFLDLYGPSICLYYNINYWQIKKLAEYVFINEEKDGIIIKNIFNILQIPTNWVLKAKKVISKYDGIETTSDLMSRLSVLPQYHDFIEKIDRLKIPKNKNTKFFSILKIIDAITSFIGLLDAVDKKVRDECQEIKPLLPEVNSIDFQQFIEKIPEIISGVEVGLKLLGYKTPIIVLNPFIEKVPLNALIANLTSLHKSFNNSNNSANLKLFFDYLNIGKLWDVLHLILYHISEDSSLCDILNLNAQQCDNLYMNVVDKSRFLISNNSFAKSVPKDVTEFYMPLLKSSSSNISDLISIVFKILTKNTKNYTINVNFTNFVISFSKLYESLVKYFERIDSNFDSKKAHFYLDVLKDNGPYELYYGQFSIIIEILRSIANGYVDENTGIDTIVKSIQPKSFLNFYQTFLKLSELKSLKISELSNAISYDYDPSKVNFNDVCPIKTIITNSKSCKRLVKEMDKNVLSVGSLSRCIGKEKMNEYLSKNIDYIIAFYSGMIIGVNFANLTLQM